MAKLILTSDGRFGGTYMDTVMLSSAPKMFFSLIKKTSSMETSSSKGWMTTSEKTYSIPYARGVST